MGVSEEKINSINNKSKFDNLTGQELSDAYEKAAEEMANLAKTSDLVLDVEFDKNGLIKDLGSVKKQLNNLEGANGNFFKQFSRQGKISLQEIGQSLMDAGFSMDQAMQIIESESGN